MLLAKIFAYNGYRVVLDPHEAHDFSVKVPSEQAILTVNRRHRDNLKTTVARQWREASGQELDVDPRNHPGLIVEKSDANATHDGRIVRGPLREAEIIQGKVYQRLIDNTAGDEVVDLRVTFHGNSVPIVYKKRRPVSSRFSNTNSGVEIAEPAAVFSDAELSKLLRFAELAGLDFGEADVLRDNESGMIWVVDSTQGPAGPPNGLSDRDKREAVERLSAAFDRMLENALSER